MHAGAGDGFLLLGTRIKCSSSRDAKLYMLEQFGVAHPFGQPYCRNITAIKVLVGCYKCASGATIGREDDRHWVVRHIRAGSCAPCTGGGDAAQAARPAATLADLQWECGMSHETTSRSVECLNPKQHRLCVECFENLAAHLMIGEERASFIVSGAQIICPLCKLRTEEFGFDMRLCASALSAETFELYMACSMEVEVIKTQKLFEARLKRMAELAAAHGGVPESECASLQLNSSLTHFAQEHTSITLPSISFCQGVRHQPAGALLLTSRDALRCSAAVTAKLQCNWKEPAAESTIARGA